MEQTDPSKFRYYVHYADFNRRMDEWIPFANFREEDGSMPRIVLKAKSNAAESEPPVPGSSVQSEAEGSPAAKKTRIVPPKADSMAPNVAAAASADLQVKRKNDNVGEFIEELTTDAMDEESLKEHDELTKVKNVGELEIGRYRIDTWCVWC